MPLIKLNDRSIKDVTSLPFGVGNLIHISSQTASNSASISFTTGINSTYKEYQFYFIDIHARTDSVDFTFNLSTDSGSNYNVTKTTTTFYAYNNEAGTDASLGYITGGDLAQSTAEQRLTAAGKVSSDADHLLNGSLQLFNPASTTYVKHFISTVQYNDPADYSENDYIAGYGNTTSAINAIRFKMSSGNFDGTIAMFGVL
jgi:hypothetical protein